MTLGRAAAGGGVLERHTALDGVRGVAVLFVLLFHTFQPTFAELLLQSGVDLFFVLSGFLITTILIRTRERSDYFRLFYARRSVRIFPLYYLVLASFLVVAAIVVHFGIEGRIGYPTAQNLLDNQWWGWLYQVNNLEAFRGEDAFPGLTHLWSLSIEEQFYLIWPLVVLLVPRKRLLPVCIGVAAFSMVFRSVTFALISRDFAYCFTLCRFDALAIGAAGAVIVSDEGLREKIRPAVEWVGRHWWVCFVLLVIPEEVALNVGLTAVSVGYLFFVLAAQAGVLRERPTRWLESRFLQELGKYSYAFYIFSLPIARVFVDMTPTGVPLFDNIFVTTVTGVLAYGMARLSWKLWEAPWLRLKDRFHYS